VAREEVTHRVDSEDPSQLLLRRFGLKRRKKVRMGGEAKEDGRTIERHCSISGGAWRPKNVFERKIIAIGL
jgi:hypothetical protein